MKNEATHISLMFYITQTNAPANWWERFLMLIGRGQGANPSATIWDRLIALWCRSNISHVELRFPDGQWFSSSPRDGGVRFKHIKFKAGRWEEISVRCTVLELECMRAHAEALALRRLKYDWLGLFGFLLSPMGGSRKRMYCSEAVNEVIKRAAGIMPIDCDHISPSAQYIMVLTKRAWRVI